MDDSFLNPDPIIHYGWHENMKGQILYTQRNNNNIQYPKDQLFMVDGSGNHEIPLPDSISCIDGGIEWSPDKSKIVFGDWEHGLHTMKSNGTGIIRLCTGDCRSPSWSPNANLIAFITSAGNLKIIDFQNLQLQSFDFEGILQTLDWSPINNRIAFHQHISERFYLKTLDIMDSSVTKVDSIVASYPAWSHDGEWIAIAQHSIDGDKIYRVHADGNDYEEIIDFWDFNTRVYCKDLAWSPDNTMIAVASKDIYIIDMTGWIVTILRTPEGPCFNLDWQ